MDFLNSGNWFTSRRFWGFCLFLEQSGISSEERSKSVSVTDHGLLSTLYQLANTPLWLLDGADNKKCLVIWTIVYCQNSCLCKSKSSVSVISASITLFLFDTYICTVYVTFHQVTLNSAFDYNSQVLVFIHASVNDAFVHAYDCDIH